MRIVERRIRSWLTSSFRPARSMGPRARARKGRNRTARSLDATLFQGACPFLPAQVTAIDQEQDSSIASVFDGR